MNYHAVNKRERSLAELVIVIALLFILMASFIYNFSKNQTEITDVGFNNLVNNFASQLIIIHSQWLMSGRPATLRLSEMNSSQLATKNSERKTPTSLASSNTAKHVKRQVLLNDKGWVINDSNNQKVIACEQVWQQIMNTPMIFNKQPIVAIKIKQNTALKNIKAKSKNDLNKDVSAKFTDDLSNQISCRFVTTSGKYFIYQSINGQIKSSVSVNSI